MLPIERPDSLVDRTYLFNRMSPEDAALAIERSQLEAWAHADVLAFKDPENAAPLGEEPVKDYRIAVTEEWRAIALEAISFRLDWLRAATSMYYGEVMGNWPDCFQSTGSHTEWGVEIPYADDGTWDMRISESGTEVYWFGHYVPPRDWAYRQKFPALKFDIRGYLIEADAGFLQRRLGLGRGKSSLARFATAVAQAIDEYVGRYHTQMLRIAQARIRKEARTLAKLAKTLSGRAKEITVPCWVYREIERYASRNAEPEEAVLLSEALGEILVVGLAKKELCLMTDSGRSVHITGEAEIVRHNDAISIWPSPDDWSLVADLRGATISQIYREPSGSVIMETDDGDLVQVSDAKHFRMSDAITV